MEKMIICLRRRRDLTPEALRQHWREIRAPLVAKHAATLGIKRYVQVFAREAPPTGGRPEGFDDIGEGWLRASRRSGRRAQRPWAASLAANSARAMRFWR